MKTSRWRALVLWAPVAWGVLAFGGVYPWAYTPLLMTCCGIGIAGLLSGGPWERSYLVLGVSLGALLLACAVQLVPFSRTTLEILSPATDRFLARYEVGYAAGAPTHPVSIAPGHTVVGVLCAAALALGLLGAGRLLSPRESAALAESVCALGAVVSLIGIVQQPFYNGRIYGFWRPYHAVSSPFGPFVNRHHFAGWMLMALPISWGFLAESAERGLARVRTGVRHKLAWWGSQKGARLTLMAFAVAMMALSLVLTMSRSGMLGFLLSLGAAAWFAVRRRADVRKRAWVVAWLGLVGMVSVAATGADAVLNRFAEQGVSLSERVAIWRNTLDIIRQFPLTGTGLNTFGTSMLLYQTADPNERLEEAHNDYLQLAAEGGLLVTTPAAIVLVVFVTIAARRLSTSRATSGYWVRAGAITGLMAIGVQELADFSLQLPGNAMLFVALCAIAIAPESRPTR